MCNVNASHICSGVPVVLKILIMSESKEAVIKLAAGLLGSELKEYDGIDDVFKEVKVSQKNTLSEVLNEFWDKHPWLSLMKELPDTHSRYIVKLYHFNVL